jgi:quercetin dioxygenase-like cupin family protein
MSDTYTLIDDLIAHAGAIQPDSIISKTFYKGGALKGILFAFDAGQELSEHTASVPAVIHILQGEASVTLGGEPHELAAGAWAHMPAQLKHSVRAKSPLVMLLLMLGGGA